MILGVMMATNAEGFEVSRKIPESPELKNRSVIMVVGIRKERHLPLAFEPDEPWLPVDSLFERHIEPAMLLAEINGSADAPTRLHAAPLNTA